MSQETVFELVEELIVERNEALAACEHLIKSLEITLGDDERRMETLYLLEKQRNTAHSFGYSEGVAAVKEAVERIVDELAADIPEDEGNATANLAAKYLRTAIDEVEDTK